MTRKGDRGKKLFYWDIVINNYNNDDCEIVKVVFENIGSSFVLGKEVGESGTPHLQGCLKLKKGNYISYVYNCLKKGGLINNEGNCKGSIRPGRNMQALLDYCMKDGDILIKHNIEEFVPKKKKSESETIKEYLNTRIFKERDDDLKKCLQDLFGDKWVIEWAKYVKRNPRLTDDQWFEVGIEVEDE